MAEKKLAKQNRGFVQKCKKIIAAVVNKKSRRYNGGFCGEN